MNTSLTTYIVSISVLGYILISCDKVHRADSGSIGGPDTIPVVNPPKDTVLTGGVNLQPSYYNSGDVNFAWDLMRQNSRIKTVRIEIEPFVNINLVRSWISNAELNGFSVIATYHDYTLLGSNDPNELLKAANWWKTNYSVLQQAGHFTINLMNEWGDHNLTSRDYATAYNSAITVLRKVYGGWIIIDCPGWGQETSIAADAVKGTGGVKINDPLVILSAHVYPNGWNQAKNHPFLTSDLDELASTKHPCIIGEFGNSPSGTVDWAAIVEYAKTKRWAVLAWSWNGDGGSMNMMTPQWSSDATASSFSQSAYFNTVYAHL